MGHPEAGEAYIAGYLVERSLSLDNVAVFAMLFTALAIPVAQRERILAWGIALALGLRIVMIAAGVALLDRFAWMVLVFGAFLLLTAWRMRGSSHDHVEPETTLAYRALGRVMPIDLAATGSRFFSRIDGRRAATPLFVAFLLVAALDVVFAVDSVPAILAITTDTYVVVAANAFALLGLRPLYGLLATAMQRVAELQQALAILLAWIGFKLIVSYWWHAPVWTSLLAIAVIIGQAVVRALLRRRRELREPVGTRGARVHRPGAPAVDVGPRRGAGARPYFGSGTRRPARAVAGRRTRPPLAAPLGASARYVRRTGWTP